jgi:hypothetical protein
MSPAAEMANGRLRFRLSTSFGAHTPTYVTRRNTEDQKIDQNELERFPSAGEISQTQASLSQTYCRLARTVALSPFERTNAQTQGTMRSLKRPLG